MREEEEEEEGEEELSSREKEKIRGERIKRKKTTLEVVYVHRSEK